MAVNQTITQIPAPPLKGVDLPAEFDRKAAEFLVALPPLGEELNIYASQMNQTAETISTKEQNAATSATAATNAKTAAETAKTGAEAAKTAAETAKTDAVTAKTDAQTAKTAAEAAKTAAAASATAAQTSADNAIGLFSPPRNYIKKYGDNILLSSINGAYGIKRLPYFNDAIFFAGGMTGAAFSYNGKDVIGGFSDQPAYDCVDFCEADGTPAALVTTDSKIIKYSKDLINWTNINVDPTGDVITQSARFIAGPFLSSGAFLLRSANAPGALYRCNYINPNQYSAALLVSNASSAPIYSVGHGRFIVALDNFLAYSSDSLTWNTTSYAYSPMHVLVDVPRWNTIVMATPTGFSWSINGGTSYSIISATNGSFLRPKYIPEFNCVAVANNVNTFNFFNGDVVRSWQHGIIELFHFEYAPKARGWLYNTSANQNRIYFAPA